MFKRSLIILNEELKERRDYVEKDEEMEESNCTVYNNQPDILSAVAERRSPGRTALL